MRVQKLMLPLALLTIAGIFSCKNAEKKERQKVIRVEKPVTKVDVTIDTSNAFNQLFIDSSLVNGFLAADSSLSDTLVNRIKSFYNSRNYQYAWFSPEGIPEHTISFWNLLKNYLNYSKDSSVYNKALSAKMEALITSRESVKVKNDSTFQQLELSLTKYFHLYADHEYAYDANFDMKTLEWYIPKKKLTLEAMLDSVIAARGQFSEAFAPRNPQYTALRKKLQQYKAIKDAGGWPRVNSKVEEMKTGYKDAAVLALKKRLKTEGFLEGEDSTFTNVYDTALAEAVNTVKEVYGYKPDGKAGKTFLKDLNVSVDERIQQILINMERMRWIPIETRDSGRAIMVNIPEYKMHVYENGRPAWDMNVVVGKESNNTTVFTGMLKTVVFSPYWNVPTSIVKKEMGGRPSAAYLARNHMEIVNGQVRQKPGPWNSLGLVKFLFPNSYDIYFHDSPAKSLFNKDKRSFSHGCIRLKEPAKFAQYVLDDTAKWSPLKIDSAMNSGKEKFVRVKRPIPVLITYFTAWVDDNDRLNFREDIYGHDAIIAKKMFLNSVGTTWSRQKAVRDSLQQIKDSIKKKELERKEKLKQDSLKRAKI
ncbi:L,D-transpeptidase family protein [Niabella sp. CC-SYL272]|uniref:L,D-transpeptidase family protein n=1 Tax=Niabella agricola TaxID=2891571 RepID=UPI001F006739|nr:L,D-transpeptidase family protein [Niabella agricola]MCF3111840.1 L,D-transpeptidase family protein [Niabella agricola]